MDLYQTSATGLKVFRLSTLTEIYFGRILFFSLQKISNKTRPILLDQNDFYHEAMY